MVKKIFREIDLFDFKIFFGLDFFLNFWPAVAGSSITPINYFYSFPIYSQVNPIVDLLNLLRVIGRQDAAQMVEKDFGPWI